jgi:hypothetical protein
MRIVRTLTEPYGDRRHHRGVRTGGLALVGVLAVATPAQAEESLYDRLWPEAPASGRLTLSQQITDHLTELGNFVGGHVGELSKDMVGMRFDGRRRRAFVRIGGGDGQYLRFNISSDIQFAQGRANISSVIDVGMFGHQIQFELPDVEMVPASYHGERGVEVRLPIFKRTW